MEEEEGAEEGLTPAQDVVSEHGAGVGQVAVGVGGVGDDDVQVEGLVHHP